eukprot:c38221_g1_i1 orf=3-200(-)
MEDSLNPSLDKKNDIPFQHLLDSRMSICTNQFPKVLTSQEKVEMQPMNQMLGINPSTCWSCFLQSK